MLKSLLLIRGIHIPSTNWSSNKSQLLKLRKKTGYTFESCKKALQLNDNSLEKVNIISQYSERFTYFSIILVYVNFIYF
jgi:hypothetical protein